MRADRLMSILMLLQARGQLTSQALADELGVSRRTILRDVDALSYAGVPLYTDGGHGGGIRLDENYRTTLTGLTASEVRALFVSENTSLLNDLGLGEATRHMRRKLSAALPPEQQSIVDQMRQRIYVDPTWWWQDDQPLPFWSALQTAVFEDRRVRAVYENYQGQVAEHLLEPYSLVAKASHWYLVARRDRQFRLYRVSRLRSIHLLDDYFSRDPGFELVTYWHEHAAEFRQAIVETTFTLQIHPERLRFVQSLLPGRFEILAEDAPAGWQTLRLQLESFELAKMLVFGLGSQARVLDPPALRDAVLRDAQALLEDPLETAVPQEPPVPQEPAVVQEPAIPLESAASHPAGPQIVLITGNMASGKSSVAQALAEQLPRCVHLRGDSFRRMIVNGQAEMSFQLSAEAQRQLRLRYDLAIAAARAYADAGFTVVYQDILIGPVLASVTADFAPYRLALVVLCPRAEVIAARELARPKSGYADRAAVDAFDRVLRSETPRLGYWLDNSDLTIAETVAKIRQHYQF